MIRTKKKFILASRSPRRANLLRQIGIKFSVHESNVDEVLDPGKTFGENVKSLSLQKALAVASHYTSGIVIGSDTIVVAGKRILGKPASRKDAAAMLRQLSGRTHTVFTGFSIVDAKSKRTVVDCEETKVTFRRLSDREIREYVRSGSPMDKAGAYGIQDDYGAVFVERLEGCYYTVVGFPLTKFYIALQKFLQS
ncbi:MAG: septum formation inhibitor Maf [Bacteroidota bacterium]|nr:septum formation inhibitor Maf [Bacteroidota bacterium]